MGIIIFACPHCTVKLKVSDSKAGNTVNCPKCTRPLVIPSPEVPETIRKEKIVGQTVESISTKVESGVSRIISNFINEQQNPAQVIEIFSKVSELLTKEERITYIAVQEKPVINVAPDAVVLTNRRFIVYHPKLLGRVDMEDFIWRDLVDVRLKEGIMGATILLQTVQGRTITLSYLPKPQARKIYATAQEMEERVREERRLREIEEKRAAAGGVVIQQGVSPNIQGNTNATGEDPVQKLKQLKEMLDATLITQGEYESKRQAILSRM